jgi:hypothetical protein
VGNTKRVTIGPTSRRVTQRLQVGNECTAAHSTMFDTHVGDGIPRFEI